MTNCPVLASALSLALFTGSALAQPEVKPQRDQRPLPAERVPQPPNPAKPTTPTDNPAAPAKPLPFPGPEHAKLAKLAGDWTFAATFRQTPGAEPQTQAGSAKLTVVLGGRFVSEEDTGDFMGRPFSNLRVWGYNNGTKRYEAMWAYTGSTSMVMLVGASDDGGKTIVYEGTFEPEAGTPSKMKITLKTVDDDHFTLRFEQAIYDAASGAVFEATYTRKK